MENNSNQADNIFNISVEGNARELLLTAATWARIIAIVAFISAGLSVLNAIIGKPGLGGAASIFSIMVALIMAAISVVINLFLYRFASNSIESSSNMSQVQFNEGIGNLKNYFKIVSIFIIIVLSLMVLGFIFLGLGRGFR
ncbi:hypothetical protein HB364_11575 [Pseudoflavitalea sp. X16]|uniref:hypothetical protein n=1 Tax=Paraflavitalea devenefica TaxID=2716334 RepID=UPI00141E9772|nr:hypothetical protein [Paraflavitalea devenefica]NII25727.1 hypothetical protein [Paraflavitalea devenefica]